MNKQKKLTKTQRLHLLFDECFNLEQEFRKNGKGFFYYTRGGGIESTLTALGLDEEYSIYRRKKINEIQSETKVN